MSNVTRRSLLHLSAGAVAAPAILRSQTAGNDLLVAFIGVGNRGSYLLEQMVQVPGVRVIAVCDLIPERAAAAAEVVAKAGGKADTYTDFREMLDRRKEIQAVVAATPDDTHKNVYPSVLEVGRHLYGEKPLALNPGDARMIVNATRRAKGLFQCGLQLRHDPNRNASEKFIHSGGIGKVLMGYGIRHGRDLPRNIPWYFNKDKSGDMVIDQGIHILDLLTWAIGSSPVRAMASGGNNLFINDPPGRTVMDNYVLILEYPGDARVNFSHHYFDPPGFTGTRELVFGTKGSIDLVTATWQPRESRTKIKLEVPNAGKDSTYMALASFVDSVKNGKPVMSNADEAFQAAMTAVLATRAIYEKRPVTWKEVVGG